MGIRVSFSGIRRVCREEIIITGAEKAMYNGLLTISSLIGSKSLEVRVLPAKPKVYHMCLNLDI